MDHMDDLVEHEHRALKFVLRMCEARGYSNVLPLPSLESYMGLVIKGGQNIVFYNRELPMTDSSSDTPVAIVIHRQQPALTSEGTLYTVKTNSAGINMDPSNPSILNQILAAMGRPKMLIDDPPEGTDKNSHIVSKFVSTCIPIILYHDDGGLSRDTKVTRVHTFDRLTHAPLVDFMQINKFQLDILAHRLQPKVTYLPRGSPETIELIRTFGARTHPKVLTIDPVARYFRAHPGDFIRYERATDISYREVKGVSLETTAAKSSSRPQSDHLPGDDEL